MDETIAVGRGRYRKRMAGSPIYPRRESLEDLERMKQIMGELFSSGQYQQEPIPLAGNLTSRDHLFDRRLARPRRISRP
jgi:hypothetical protein